MGAAAEAGQAVIDDKQMFHGMRDEGCWRTGSDKMMDREQLSGGGVGEIRHNLPDLQ
mgnify:CR=1 FL=1